MTHLPGPPLSEVGRISTLVLKHARDAFRGQDTIDGEWMALNFTAPPEFERAVTEYDRFLDLLLREGASVHMLPPASGVGLDSVYVRDASVVSAHGVIMCRMGKETRAGEPSAQRAALAACGISILGAIEPPGQLEGGDVVWLDDRTVAVGRGYRTNASGIAQFRALLGETIDELIEVPLVHWRGPQDVFHLMSVISPVDRDLAVGYSPLMPVPFREHLLEHGYTLVEVPDEEFESMGANVLAIAPRRCVMLAGNKQTRNRLERAGAQVLEYEGREISLKGGGGPTCLTRPLERAPVTPPPRAPDRYPPD
jgi:N-dimethylarginine dimethylaminohydrolase